MFARKEGQEINEVAVVAVRPSIGVAPEGTLISPAALLAQQLASVLYGILRTHGVTQNVQVLVS